ncbi:cation diffusion facilitator family transporter [Hymenobacter humi]|uniref:Cation diffusion facilitator family transporter n=1 Tax=Hymenobacter humi TaxID=1411620 RepID=A0ABW2U1K2_9BACT
MASPNSSKLALYGGIVANVAIAVSKFVAAYFTGSSAMLSEGIHSLVDTGNGVLLLFGIRQSQLPANSRHPFGRSKELYFWALIVAVLIFAIGGGMSFYEGVKHLQDPSPLEDPTWNYVILGLSIVFEGLACYLAVKALYAVPAEEKPASSPPCAPARTRRFLPPCSKTWPRSWAWCLHWWACSWAITWTILTSTAGPPLPSACC